MEHYTVVVMLCHILADIAAPVCHEEIVTRQEMTRLQCAMSQPAIAEWKENSIYHGEQWSILGFKCSPGNYIIRDDI